MLPVEQADDLPVRVGRFRNDDVVLLEVGMADAELIEGRVAGDEGRRDEEIAAQALCMVRRRLLLVSVSLPPSALERQQRLTELLQIRQFLVGCSYKRCFHAFVYSYRLVQGSNKTKAESGVHGPRSTLSCDLLPYHRASLTSGPTQTRSSLTSLSGMPRLPFTFSRSCA